MSQCFICGSTHLPYLREAQGEHVCKCADCGLLLLDPQPNEAAGATLASGPASVHIEGLERSPDPAAILEEAHAQLSAGGTLTLSLSDLDGGTQFSAAQLYYFDEQSIQNALAKASFDQVEVRRANGRLEVRCAWKAKRERPLLSIVVPVYNEAATFPTLIAALQAKALPGVDKEIILVESHSRDGTRDQVLAFQGRPGFKVVLQDQPRGKGNAVRDGLKVATGDILMIQDGDLEYDINDYDQLLEPLLRFQCAFVLGSRHLGGWKIRQFTGQPVTSYLLNGAHLFFTLLLNLTCGSWLKDPFTMYKVFRRDCLHRLTFKADRFDFDFELMIKLLRKGYQPLEIGVNYRSRSFQEGKKVRLIRDPLTWFVALVRFRFAKLYE